MSPNETRNTVLRLVVTVLVLGGAWVGVCLWSAQHLPASATVGGIAVGGMTPERAQTAILRGSRDVLSSPMTMTLPGSDDTVQVVPEKAGLGLDASRSVEGLTGFTLDPREVWTKLTDTVELPLLTRTDDDVLTATLEAIAPTVDTAAVEGSVTFPRGAVSMALPTQGRSLDVVATKLALRRAFPDERTVAAVLRHPQPVVSAEAIREAATGFAASAMSGPVTVVSGGVRATITPADYGPAVTMVPSGDHLEPAYDQARLLAVVSAKVAITTTPAKPAGWVFDQGRPKLVPAVAGRVVDEASIPALFAAALTSPTRTMTITPVVADADFTSEEAVKVGVREVVSTATSPVPRGDAATAANITVAAARVTGAYVAPGATFRLNARLGERTEANGYGQGVDLVDGRLVRVTAGGISRVAAVVYGLAYDAGVRVDSVDRPGIVVGLGPVGREATAGWPGPELTWTNDTPYGMLLRVWVEGGVVRGQVWSTRVWDIKAVTGPRANLIRPRDIQDSSAGCVPQQSQPGFDITVRREWYAHGSTRLVKSESFTSGYAAADRITCTAPR
ncbi:MAG: VanW family protein [Terracoccus sp.]